MSLIGVLGTEEALSLRIDDMLAVVTVSVAMVDDDDERRGGGRW
jgi:hypothetical protein